MFDRGILGFFNRSLYTVFFAMCLSLGIIVFVKPDKDWYIIGILIASCLAGWFVAGIELRLLYLGNPSFPCICFLLVQIYLGMIFLGMLMTDQRYSPIEAVKKFSRATILPVADVLIYYGITFLLDYLYKRHIMKKAEEEARLQAYLDREETR